MSRTIAYRELFVECYLPNDLGHTIFYDKPLFLGKSEKDFSYINDESEVHFVLCSFVCWGQDLVDITSSLGHQELELPPCHATHSFICQRPWRLYICPRFLKLFFIEPLTKVLIYLDSVSRIMPMPHPIPSFLFPSKWGLAEGPALCWWILHVLLVPQMLVYIVSSQDYCSLTVEGLHGAPQALESFWNLSSTLFRHINCHKRGCGPSVVGIQSFWQWFCDFYNRITELEGDLEIFCTVFPFTDVKAGPEMSHRARQGQV